MAAKFTYDTTNKLFILVAGTTSLDVKQEFYSAAKNDWRTDTGLNRLRFPILAVGGQNIGGGQTISPYYQLRYGWKVRPQEVSHELVLTGNLITDDGTDPFVNTVGNYNVRIKYVVTANSISLNDAAIAADIAQARKVLTNRRLITTDSYLVIFDDDGITPLLYQYVKDKMGSPITLSENVPAEVEDST